MQRNRSLALLVVGAVAALALVGCGESDSAEVTALQSAVTAAARASTDGDVEQFARAFTDRGLMEEYGMARADFVQLPPEEIAYPVSIREFGKARVKGDTATVEVVFQLNDTWLDGSTVHFVKEDGSWRIDRGFETEDYEVKLPGVEPLDVEMTEFAFLFDPDDFAGKVVQAFALENTGAQEHEAVLVRVDREGTLLEIVDAILAAEGDEPPAGVEFIAATAAQPGDAATLVLTKPLEPGRYAFVCFFEDAGDPGHLHVQKGMVADFEIGV